MPKAPTIRTRKVTAPVGVHTVCPGCGRYVGVVRPPGRRAEDPERRISRHSLGEPTYNGASYVRRPICPSSGLVVTKDALIEAPGSRSNDRDTGSFRDAPDPLETT